MKKHLSPLVLFLLDARAQMYALHMIWSEGQTMFLFHSNAREVFANLANRNLTKLEIDGEVEFIPSTCPRTVVRVTTTASSYTNVKEQGCRSWAIVEITIPIYFNSSSCL